MVITRWVKGNHQILSNPGRLDYNRNLRYLKLLYDTVVERSEEIAPKALR